MSPTPTNVHEQVARRYSEIADSGGACCSGGKDADAVLAHARSIGYDARDLRDLPEGANLGLGCGSPTSLAMIEPGMTVVDLGSGAGVDCFIAANKLAGTGQVIGIDMTDAMLQSARQYATEKGYTNVQFRKGQIEQLPLEEASVDLVISNCVINLSPDKPRVFAEIARVLKPGGRAAISDIVLLADLPDAIRQDMEAYIGCIAGAQRIGDYLGDALSSGLDVDSARRKGYDVMAVLGCSPEAGKLLEKIPAGFDGASTVASLDVVLRKPAPEGRTVPLGQAKCC
jgi:SAM-dependent methyltransferase